MTAAPLPLIFFCAENKKAAGDFFCGSFLN